MALPTTPPPDLPSSAAVTTTTTVTATTTTTTVTNPPIVRRFQNPAIPTRPQSLQSHYHHPQPTTYPLPSPHFYTTQPRPNLAHRQPTTSIHHQSAPRPHDPSPGILYPVASSGRGFLPKGVRPQSVVDQSVTVASQGGIPPRPVAYPHHHPVRPYGFPHHEGQVVHHIRSGHLQHSLVGSIGGAVPGGVVRGVPVPVPHKAAPSHPHAESNGFKDSRDRSKDDGLVTVRHRKVRISEGSSLYALCRSWLRNGVHEENQQPQYIDGLKSLPRPLPVPVVDEQLDLPVEKEGNKEDDEEEGSVEHLSPAELLQRHTNRAKRVRARLREERIQRIERYKSRLALLLPSPIENQQMRNDAAAAAAGN